MRARAIEVLACPLCLGPLSSEVADHDEIINGTLTCPHDGIVYPIEDGIPKLVTQDRVDKLETFASSYAAAWAKDGWGSPDPRYLLDLPFNDSTRRRPMEWRLKARSLSAVLLFLDGIKSKLIIDLGAGVGWLSYHLALQGGTVFAMDVLLDKLLGLGAASRYIETGVFFERVWGDLERPPFLDESADIVICNASLHYARDLGATLSEISRILAPGGTFIVMNSPVHRDPASAARAETDFRTRLELLGANAEVSSSYHHLVREPLESQIRSSVGPPREVQFPKGFLFQANRFAKATILRMELASFPLYYARKPS
jgi:uncharacterized protein YbaR (Trm112 family)/ubiquinone/menaquinone biosynthesis C-methylase UbiE